LGGLSHEKVNAASTLIRHNLDKEGPAELPFRRAMPTLQADYWRLSAAGAYNASLLVSPVRMRTA